MTTAAKEILTSRMVPRFQDPDGSVNYHKLAAGLTVRVKDLSSAIHKTTRALEKNYKTNNIQQDLRKIVYIWILLREMLGSDSEILQWLKSPNPDFDGAAPIEIICDGRSEAIIDYLSNIKTGQLS
jgi:uncharacterized protein (DUF2384 family)